MDPTLPPHRTFSANRQNLEPTRTPSEPCGRVRRSARWTAIVAAGLAGCAAPPTAPSINSILHWTGDRFGTFGPTGERLFADRLDPAPGVRGRFRYLHAAKAPEIADPIVLEFTRGGETITLDASRIDWYPSHVHAIWEGGGLVVHEWKFISDDDCLVEVIDVAASSADAGPAALRVVSGFATHWGPAGTTDAGKPRLVPTGTATFFDVPVTAAMVANGLAPPQGTTSDGPAVLATAIDRPNATPRRFVVAVGFAGNASEAAARAARWTAAADPVATHARQYQQWFIDNCPGFECSDPYMTRCWWYRWYIARHCLSRARTGNLPEPCYFEGTRRENFPSLIAFSSGHIIDETRWLRDATATFGQVRDHIRSASAAGYFQSARVNGSGWFYTNWISLAAWNAFCVRPDAAWLAEVWPGLARDVDGVLASFDKDGDTLVSPPGHGTTGMEFQPSFFYFNDYDDTKPEASLERPDFVAYVYGNARAVAAAARRLGRRDDAIRFERLAQEIRTACLSKLWDEKDAFFYAARTDDDAKARVREIAGFYPYMSRLVPDEPKYTRQLAYLADTSEFWNPWPLATVSKTCPVYSPSHRTWPGPGGRISRCMWNGPTWPHADAIILNVMREAITWYHQPYITPEHFWRLLDRYTHMHYEQDDVDRPLLWEYYDGVTGAGDREGCPDYFHSTYNDVLVRGVAGLTPDDSDDVRLTPIAGPLTYFRFDDVPYRGHRLTIVYDAGEHDRGRYPHGLSLYVDGRLVAQRADLGPLAAPNALAKKAGTGR